MALAPQPVGRRERNKQDRLDRIMAAAGVEEIDTCPPAGFARELARANRS
jgi:hypothetical protein